MDRRAAAAPYPYIDPAFGAYRDRVAWALTEFLYGDKNTNPLWDQPDKWHRVGHVTLVWKTLDFNSMATGGDSTQTLSMAGGKNSVIMGFTATVKLSTASTPRNTVMPNEQLAYVTIRQKRADGFFEIPTAPLSNVAGNGAWPAISPIPQRWFGNVDREIRIDNDCGGNPRDINLAWQVAVLDTGR
tara:strand:- start:2493 stop:3050 length:558 start_codon:yes stop_codon:yes gene_type:complete